MRTHRLLLLLSVFVGVAAIAHPAASKPTVPTRGELRWLGRVTFGVDAAVVARYQQLGREKFLEEQLTWPAADAPAIAAIIATLPSTQRTAEVGMKTVRAEQQRINALPNEDEKQKARMAMNQAGNQVVYETTKRHLVRAVQSSAQLREQMTCDMVLDESLLGILG